MEQTLETRKAVVQQGIWLEYITLAWNSMEALVAVFAGFFAGSIALVGFGFDSVVECSSGAVLLWRLHSDANVEKRDQVERSAVRFVGASFLLLSVYIGYDAITALIRRETPERSLVGIALAVVSLIVMPLLARAKRSVATTLGSEALHADSRQTDICAYLSAILLGGLLLNAVFGWWWADPVAALVMVPIVSKEGIEGLRGKACSCARLATAKDSCCHE